MKNTRWWFALIVATLGYFVDVYDIILFSAVRVPSLRAIGIAEENITSVGLQLLNVQVVGMLIGGVVWGMLGDKKGRMSILFGSILLYSSATLANAFVTSLPGYAALRFLAGFGLAGELGAGITLVSELMSRKNRGYGTMLIVMAGALGGVTGGIVGNNLSWQSAYILGGLGGFLLLLLRMGVKESHLFMTVKNSLTVPKGSMWLLLRSSAMRLKYLRCLCVGMPFWIFVGLFLALAPELGKAKHVLVPITSAMAIIYYNIGLVLGECMSGLLSQWCKNRKKIVQLYLMLCLTAVISFVLQNHLSEATFYRYCLAFGFSSGFWVLFVMISSEQFGTNMRATVTTSLPNLVRAMVFPCALLVTYLKVSVGVLPALSGVLLVSLLLGLIATYFLKETFAIDLDFIESQ